MMGLDSNLGHWSISHLPGTYSIHQSPLRVPPETVDPGGELAPWGCALCCVTWKVNSQESHWSAAFCRIGSG